MKKDRFTRLLTVAATVAIAVFCVVGFAYVVSLRGECKQAGADVVCVRNAQFR